MAEEARWASAPPHLTLTPLQVAGSPGPVEVSSISQDDRGYLWIGGTRGLARYDGYELSHRGLEAVGMMPGGLAAASIVALEKDPQGRIWAGTRGSELRDGEVLGHDPATEQWTPHPVYAEWAASAGSSAVEGHRQITDLLWDAKGSLWVGSAHGLREITTSGVVRLHRSTSRSDDAGADSQEPETDEDGCRLRDEHVTVLLEDIQGTLWVGTRGGLHRYDRVQSCFQPFRHDDDDPRSLSADHVTALLEDSQGTLWVGTAGGGLDRMLGGDGQFFHSRFDRDDPMSLPDDHITTLFEDSLERLWVGTEKGLSRLQTSTGHFDRYVDGGASSGMPAGAVRVLFEDETGTLWVGGERGIAYLPALRRYFHHYLEAGVDIEHDLRDTLAVYEDLNRRLWVGTAHRGLFVIDRQRRLTHHFYEPVKDLQGESAALGVSAIAGNGRGEIWLGTLGAGVWWRHPESRLSAGDVLKPLPHDGSTSDLDRANVSDLAVDAEHLWIATVDAGLYRYHKDRRRLTPWRHDAADASSLASDSLSTLWYSAGEVGTVDAEGDNGDKDTADGIGDGILWVGTRGAGLDRLRFASRGETSIEHFGDLIAQRFGRHVLDVNDLFEDAHGDLWVATEGGLLKWDRETSVFTIETRLDGQAIQSIQADRDDHLWISGGDGLWRLPLLSDDTSKNGGEVEGLERIERFSVEHGVQGKRFSPGAAFHGRGDEELFFGGELGVTAFSPQLIVLERPSPTVVLTEVAVEGIPRSLNQGDWDVVLDSDERELRVEVAALDFVDPAKNQYAFFLEGEDRGWIETGGQRHIRYSRLRPGSYTLHVAAAHADGVWNREGLRLGVEVTPRLRQRPAFQITLALAAAAGIALLVMIWDRGRNRRQVRLRELEIEGKQRQLGAQEDERSRLAREIYEGALTTLPSMAAQLEGQNELDADGIRVAVDSLRRTTSELQDISSRLHSPVLGRFGLAAAIRERLARLRRESPRLEIQIDLDEDGQRLSEAVRLALYRIFEQALDNAVRHGDPSWVRVVFELSTRSSCLRVLDDGRGFRVPLKWMQLLRGKYQGLLDMVERAESIGGRCHIRSIPRRGTEVRVVAPHRPPRKRSGRRLR